LEDTQKRKPNLIAMGYVILLTNTLVTTDQTNGAPVLITNFPFPAVYNHDFYFISAMNNLDRLSLWSTTIFVDFSKAKDLSARDDAEVN
jgi:hypothetical protein